MRQLSVYGSSRAKELGGVALSTASEMSKWVGRMSGRRIVWYIEEKLIDFAVE